MKKIISIITRPFVVLRATIAYHYAKHRCNYLHEKDGKRRWVLVNQKHRLCILTYDDIRHLRRIGVMNQDSNLRVLREECFYSTELFTDIEIESKRKAWIKYSIYCSMY